MEVRFFRAFATLRGPRWPRFALLALCATAFPIGAIPAAFSAPASGVLAATVEADPPHRFEADRPGPVVAFEALAPRLVLSVDTDRRALALTFDLDMTPEMAARLRAGSVHSWVNQDAVSLLESTKTHATLFMTGMWAELYPDLARRLASEGQFEIANHSYSHPAFHAPCYRLGWLGPGGAAWELQRSQQAISGITGATPRYFRFPGGCYDRAALDAVHAAGLTPVGWTVSSMDAFNPNAGQIASTVLNEARPGAIIVMHLMGGPNAPATADALRTIIPALRSEGYDLVTVGDLLAAGQAVVPTDPREVYEVAPAPVRPCTRWWSVSLRRFVMSC